jgi:hypothetical protein
MRFMNEWDIEEANRRFADEPVLGPAARTLRNLMEWTNRNSDGWCYWPKPCRAAAKLQEMLERYSPYRSALILQPTAAEYRKALVPIKAFRTRQAADFDIEDVA